MPNKKNNDQLSDIKFLLYDKISLIIASMIIAFFTYTFIDNKKEEIVFENSISLKFADYQLETYTLANEVAYLSYLRLYLFISTENNKSTFSEIMQDVIMTSNKLNNKIYDFKVSLIKYSPFLSSYSVNKIYMPLLLELNKLENKFIENRTDYNKTISTAKVYIGKIKNYQTLLNQFIKNGLILEKIKPKKSIDRVKLLDINIYNFSNFKLN